MPGTGLGIPISGICPVTTIDYPGKIAAVLFTQGCPYRCPYCHNENLRKMAQGAISGEEVLAFVGKRRGLLEAVVISGGEPTIHVGLPQAAETLKKLGFLVGLHSAGASPQVLEKTLPFLDWVGLDFKGSTPHQCQEITGQARAFKNTLICLKMLQKAGKNFQIRTTFFPGKINEQTAEEIDGLLKTHGAGPTIRQAYREKGQTSPKRSDINHELQKSS